MLEQVSIQDVTPNARSASACSEQALTAARRSQVEACLDHLCSRASGDAPQRVRNELRGEMENGLDRLVAAHQELGSSLDAATVAALQQLRLAYAVPTTAQHTQVRTKALHRHPELRDALLPLGLFSTFYLADMTHVAWNLWAHANGLIVNSAGQVAADATMGLSDGPGETAYYRFELLVVPLLVGLITGLALRQRAGRAVLTSLKLLAALAILLPGFVMGLAYYAELWPHKLSVDWLWNPLPGIVGVTFWTALGYTGALAGSWLRRCGVKLERRTRKHH